jgi:hypothetical protein
LEPAATGAKRWSAPRGSSASLEHKHAAARGREDCLLIDFCGEDARVTAITEFQSGRVAYVGFSAAAGSCHYPAAGPSVCQHGRGPAGLQRCPATCPQNRRHVGSQAAVELGPAAADDPATRRVLAHGRRTEAQRPRSISMPQARRGPLCAQPSPKNASTLPPLRRECRVSQVKLRAGVLSDYLFRMRRPRCAVRPNAQKPGRFASAPRQASGAADRRQRRDAAARAR